MRRVLFLLSVALISVLIPPCLAQSPARRPMTFEDMMKMKRLGATAVSPDGKWLAYSVTTVDLEQNTTRTELWLQAIAGGEPQKLAVTRIGDSGIQFAPDGRSVLFLSGREGGQQIWLADFDPATGGTSNPKKLTSIATEADNAKWSPDGHSVLFASGVYPDCPPITLTAAALPERSNPALYHGLLFIGSSIDYGTAVCSGGTELELGILSSLTYRNSFKYFIPLSEACGVSP